MLPRGADELRCQSPGIVEVPGPNGKGASSQGKCGTQGDGVVQAPGLLHGDLKGLHRLFGISLKPKDAGQDVTRHDVQVKAGAVKKTAPGHRWWVLKQMLEAPARGP